VTPYRISGESPAPREPESGPDDDPVILWIALVVSLLGLIPRLLDGGSWGAEPTIALLIASTSAALLVRRTLRQRQR